MMRFSWENLSTIHGRKGEPSRHRFPINGRCWLYIGKKTFTFEWDIWSKSCGISFNKNEDYTFNISIPPISFYFSFGKCDGDRKIGIDFHNGAIWWKFWVPTMEWSSSTPVWMDGNFNFVDFILGKIKFSKLLIEERDVLIPMPEKAYEANVKLFECTWKRSRWFPKRGKYVDIKVEEGVPHQGKGTCSYNCGTDASFGLWCPAIDICDGIGKFIGNCLQNRIKYGGWDDYCWQKEGVH